MTEFTVVNLWKLLILAYGNSLQIINAVQVLYEDTSTNILSREGENYFLKISAVFLQWGTSAPLLFILALDYAMRKATTNPHETGFTVDPRCNRRYPEVTITYCFADNIALISDAIDKAQLPLPMVETASKSVVPRVSVAKTESMVYNQDDISVVTSTVQNLETR